MKICHVTSAHNRYDGRIFLKQCSSLAKKYDVILLCCDDLPEEKKNNVTIKSVHEKFKNRYQRIIFSNMFFKKACLNVNADIYEFHDPDLLGLAKYMKKKGKKVIFDSHEDYPALFLERDWIPNFVRKILRYIYIIKEHNIFKNIDCILCASNHIKKRIEKINKNTFFLPNYPIINNNEIKRNENKAKFKICFAGGIRKEWNHQIITEAIQNIDNIEYHIAGYVDDRYKEEINKIDINKKVKFIGRISQEEVRKLYESSNIGMALCSYRPNVNYKEGSLGITKIFEYMMYGLPVIFTDFDVFEEINNEMQYGIAVNPYNIADVKKAIIELLESTDKRKSLGSNGKKLINKKYNWNILEKDLFNIYIKIVNKL